MTLLSSGDGTSQSTGAVTTVAPEALKGLYKGANRGRRILRIYPGEETVN